MLGSETDAVAVQTVDLSAPTYFTYMNATDYIKLGASVYTRNEINAATPTGSSLRALVRPTSCIDTMNDQLKDTPGCFQPFAINFPVRFGAGTVDRARVNLPTPKKYHRLAMLLPPTPNGSVNISQPASPCVPNTPLPVTARRVQTNYIPDNSPAGYAINIDIGRVASVRSVRSYTSVTCINIGDGTTIASGDNRDIKMAPLTGVDLKPVQTLGFSFTVP